MLRSIALFIVAVFFGFLFACIAASSIKSAELPQHIGRMNDFTATLSLDQQREINDSLGRVKGAQMVIAIVPDMGGASVEDYSKDLFHKWGIGNKKEDNGILVLVAKKERKVRIEVGYGAEAFIPDAVAAGIIQKMLPSLKIGNYATAFVVAIGEVQRLANNGDR